MQPPEDKESPRSPAAMTQQQVDSLVSDNADAREIRARLLSEDHPPLDEPVREGEASASPVPLSQGDLDEIRAGRGKVQERIQQATKSAGGEKYDDTHERPGEVPPHLRQK